VLATLVLLFTAACASGSDDSSNSDTTAGDTTAGDTTEISGTTGTTATPVTSDVTPQTATTAKTAAGAVDAEYGGDPMSSDRTVFEDGDIDIGLTPFIDDAISDLADRLDIDPAAIEPVTGVLVVWSDSSLGCPEPDMIYAQVVGDGSVIELRVGDRYYRYHTGGEAELFLCEQPWSDSIVGGDSGGLAKPDALDGSD
jgi:hypothetical protein